MPIQLHLDLVVKPGKETQMVENYYRIFQPTISRQTGFVEVRLMKLRSVIAGKPPGKAGFRLLISFETEEQRLTWVHTPEHQETWSTIENSLAGSQWGGVLYDVI